MLISIVHWHITSHSEKCKHKMIDTKYYDYSIKPATLKEKIINLGFLFFHSALLNFFFLTYLSIVVMVWWYLFQGRHLRTKLVITCIRYKGVVHLFARRWSGTWSSSFQKHAGLYSVSWNDGC